MQMYLLEHIIAISFTKNFTFLVLKYEFFKMTKVSLFFNK